MCDYENFTNHIDYNFGRVSKKARSLMHPPCHNQAANALLKRPHRDCKGNIAAPWGITNLLSIKGTCIGLLAYAHYLIFTECFHLCNAYYP